MVARPSISCINEKPGPLVAVMALAPVMEAPITLAMAAISSSVWNVAPPTSGRRRAISSRMSEAGVMG